MNSADIALKKIVLDLEAVFPDPAAEAKEWLEKYNEERGNGGEPVSQKACPECGESVEPLEVKCPGCGADLRSRCELCSLPLSGEQPLCSCGGFENEKEREEFFENSPRSRKANKPDGGKGHGPLRMRRALSGY